MPAKGASVQQNKDGSVTVEYHPTDQGTHELNLIYNEQTVDGMPFRCHVDKAGGGYVTAYGPGLLYGASGKHCEFSVVGGGKDVDVKIKGPNKTDMKKKEGKGGLVDYIYMPTAPGEYDIDIKFKGKHIHGSPFSSKVSGDGHKRSQLSLTATSEVALGSKKVDLAGLVGTLKTPGGSKENCLLKKMPDGTLGIASFVPKSKGTYVIDVQQDGSKIAGSPFNISVGDGQVASANKCKLNGGGISNPVSQKWNDVDIDVTQAGHGGLGISVEGPHRSDIECKESSPKVFGLKFKPHEPGVYLLNIKFGDDHVTGSPFMLNVGGESSGRIRTTIEKDIAAAEHSTSGTKCEFQLKIPGTDPLDMEACLTFPSGKSDLCEIMDQPGSLYDIKFVPTEEGIHTVSLKAKGLHISGSPFQYTVGKSPSGGTHKVEIGGPGLEKGEVGAKNEFNIYTREAGGGHLTVIVEGLSKAEMDVVDRGHGYTTVGYKVTKPGTYAVHVKYNDHHVPDSPTNVYIVPTSAAAKKVTIHGLRDRGLEIDKPATFNVNLNGAKGELHAHLDVPSGQEEDIFVQELDRDMYALRFMPKENGIYYVHIKLSEAHIPGSPFPMLVGKMGADPALVLAKGTGLEKGESGKQSTFTVLTSNAGCGTLKVQIDGTSKVAIMCTEVDEGYEFTYTPMAPGDYLIQIKYCNVSIAGMPTMAVITGKGKASDIKESSGLVVETVEKKPGQAKKKKFVGDASKVVAKGNGLKKAFMNRPGNFTVDVKGAGNGLLMIGMITPTGNPIAELCYRKQRGTVYQVNFKCPEKGNHTMSIRWGADDIAGSPFTIIVA